MTLSQRILDLARSRRVLRARDVNAIGGSGQLLVNLCRAGRLQRLSRGLYALPDLEPGPHRSLEEACCRSPRGVVCLLSALRYHGIGTQAPHELWLALPAGSRAPRAAWPPLRVIRLTGEALAGGIVTAAPDGVPLRVYGVEKTVTDCFKFRHRIGLDVALEALHDAWRQRRLDMNELARFARVHRVERVMQPYLDTLPP